MIKITFSVKLSYVFMLSLFFLYACDQDVIRYNQGNIESDHDKKDSVGEIRINFEAQMVNYATRSAVSPIQSNRYATVYAYDNNQLSTYEKYFSKAAGTLTPLKSAMNVATGKYNFYAVGINKDNVAVPSFVDGVCGLLINNVDYIWWQGLNYVPLYPQSNYTINFQHSCTQVVLKINLQSGIIINSFNYISLTPSSLEGISWNLFSGEIGPSSSIALNPDTLTYSNPDSSLFMAQMTMAPIRTVEETKMTVNFELTINGEIAPRTYSTFIPVYNNDMRAGFSYQYDLLLRTDTILLNTVNVVNWVDVDVTDRPIIPTESD